MPQFDKFLIGYNDNNSGFQSNVKPWLITDNAFETLNDVYVLRGRVKKRFGTVLMGGNQLSSRLRLNTGASYSMSVYSGTVPGTVFEIGQMFSVGDDIFTVYQTGTPAAMLATNVATSGTFNTSTGAFTITGYSSGLNIYFYPAQPVMGLVQYYVEATNVYTNLAFDTQFSYQFDTITQGWEQITSGADIWTGTDYDFFWSAGYQAAITSLNTLWTTNFNPADGIRYWNNTIWVEPVLNWTKGPDIDTTDGSGDAAGTVSGGTGFIGQVFTIGTTTFTVVLTTGALLPTSNSTAGPMGTGTFDTTTGDYTFTGALANAAIYFTGDNFIETAQIIVQFKNRLVLLNTIESVGGVTENFPYRCRFSALNDPIASSSFMQDFPGNGGFVDAPTDEAIITAQFVKDRLIVYFSASTYELVYTNNQVLPFIFQKINNELGAVSTFSEIPFDKVTLGIDDNGIHACNGANVDRIDNKIPQFPFGISNENNGQDRVAGVRDFYNEMAYWTISTNNRSDAFYFPNQILVYNYVNESWATITDSFTTFGYFFQPAEAIGLTWGETTTPWGVNGNMWNSSSSTLNNTTIKTVIAGNQEGFIQILQPETFNNAPSLQVTNFTVTANGQATISCINHNLELDQFIVFSNMNGLTFTDSLGNAMTTLMARVSSDTINLSTADTFTIQSLDNASQPIITTGTYTGGGVCAIVSNLSVLTKQYNFYTEADRNMYLSRVDFLVDKTLNGQVTADYLISSTNISLVSEGIGTNISPGPLPGTSALETSPYTLSTLEQFQSRLWHPVYMWSEGECVQLQLYMTPSQMFGYTLNDDNSANYVALNDFELHAMVFYVTPTTARMT